jgi:hypothetical protein
LIDRSHSAFDDRNAGASIPFFGQQGDLMTKLRHAPSESSPFPVAAEVCETRALLSAGAAVHSALDHAQASSHAAPAPNTAGTNFSVTVHILVGADTPIINPGQATISPIIQRVGAPVKAHLSTAFNSPGNANVLNITLSGKIQSVQPHTSNINFLVRPVGALKLTQTPATGHVIHFTYKPTNPLTIATDLNGTFTGLDTTFTHPPVHGIPFLPIEIRAIVD